jgi:hypothetical protein
MGEKKLTLCSLERSVEEISRKPHCVFERDLWRGFLETTTYLSRKIFGGNYEKPPLALP